MAVDFRFRSALFGSGCVHVRCLPCKSSGRMGDKAKSKLKQEAVGVLDKSQIDKSDACHFKKILAETKQNGSYGITFLPTVLSNWCSPRTTFGISIITPASGPSENTSYAFIWVTLVPVGPGVEEGGLRYGAQKTTCCLFPDPVLEREFLERIQRHPRMRETLPTTA